MKKFFSLTLIFSLTFTCFAHANTPEHAAHGIISKNHQEFVETLAESQAATQKWIEKSARSTKTEALIALEIMQLEAYKGAREITIVDGKKRYIAAIVGVSAVTIPTILGVMKYSKQMELATRPLTFVGKLAATLIVAAGGVALFTLVGGVLVMSEQELNTAINKSMNRIKVLSAQP